MKIVNINGGLYYQRQASSIVKSNRKIYKNCSGVEKFKRATDKYYEELPQTKHSKQRVRSLYKKGLIR